MYGGSDAGGGPMAKQAKQLGLRAKIVSGDGTCTEKVVDLAGDAAENIVCSEASMALEKMPGGKQFQEKYVKRFGSPIQAYAPFSYDAVYILVDAMKRANSTDPAKILAAMPATNYSGVIGKIAFDPHGDLTHGTISIFTFRAGKKTLLDEVRL
jgi:branched-chain amino acid transport system substrate-binding protein